MSIACLKKHMIPYYFLKTNTGKRKQRKHRIFFSFFFLLLNAEDWCLASFIALLSQDIANTDPFIKVASLIIEKSDARLFLV